jgi:hypothetical protein
LDDLDTTRLLLQKTVYSLCPEQQQRAWLLVEQLDKRKFMFSERGEFIPQGFSVPIAGSDVKLLIEYILTPASTRGKEPKGFDQFMKQFMDVEACRTPAQRVHRRSERERRH